MQTTTVTYFADIHSDAYVSANLAGDSGLIISALLVAPIAMPKGLEWLSPELSATVHTYAGARLTSVRVTGQHSHPPQTSPDKRAGLVDFGVLCPGRMAMVEFALDLDPEAPATMVRLILNNDVSEAAPGAPDRLSASFGCEVLHVDAAKRLRVHGPHYQIHATGGAADSETEELEQDEEHEEYSIDVTLEPGRACCPHSICFNDVIDG